VRAYVAHDPDFLAGELGDHDGAMGDPQSQNRNKSRTY
jgi:hypothetical protein